MRRPFRAAEAAKSLLSNASQRLLTPDPTRMPDVCRALDHSLDWSIGEGLGRSRAYRPFEPNFSETAANSLAFAVSPGGQQASASERSEMSTEVMRQLVDHHFGPGALRWFDDRSEPQRARFARRRNGSRGFGAMFSTGVDRTGLAEAAVTYEWGDDDMDALASSVFELARTALDALPGLKPFLTTIRCGRRSGGQQVIFGIDRELDLNELLPLMDALGLGHRHGGLLSLAGFILGARFALPAHTATLTLLNTSRGVELRLDVNLDALPDAPAQLLPLLRMPMTERPQSLAALDRWMTALTPEGYYGPGNVSVLSIRVRPDMPARLALYLRPVAFQAEAADVESPVRRSNGGNGRALPPGEFESDRISSQSPA